MMRIRQLRGWLARVGGLFTRAARDGEFEAELESHLEMHINDNLRAGLTAEEARRQALIRLGGEAQTHEAYRRATGVPMLEDLWQDLRYGLRLLRKSPGFTLVAVVTLALGIGANTAIFSLVDAVLLQPLRFRDPEQLVMVWEDASIAGFPENTPAPANYVDWRTQNRSFTDTAALADRNYNLTGEREPEKIEAQAVTSNFFSLLGVTPLLGRAFVPTEDKSEGDRVAVLSYGLWQSRFGGERDIIGRDILLNGEKHTVVGVMPAGFQFLREDVNIWVPLDLKPEDWAARGSHFLHVVARLKTGVTVAEANADIQTVMRRIVQDHPNEATGLAAYVVPLHQQLTGEARRPLLMLLVAVGFVLLIACANVANLLLARAAARGREIGIRLALGASRWRITRQLLTESAMLSALGGALGLLLAMWSFNFLQQLIPPAMVLATSLRIDNRVLAFTLLIVCVTCVLFGLAPALQASRANLNAALSQGVRTGSSPGHRRLRSIFVVAEVALALVLLVGAGLLIQTLYKLRNQYTSLQPEHVLTLRTVLPETRYKTHEQRVAFYDQVLQRVAHLPGVVAAGYTTSVPLEWKGGTNGFVPEGMVRPSAALSYDANFRHVSPDYFKALGIVLRAGRYFGPSDGAQAQPVAIINETMADQYWPHQNPVGKRFQLGDPDPSRPLITIVGVVADVRQMGLDAPIKAEMYFPHRQDMNEPSFAPRDLVIRTSGDPSNLVAAARREIWAVDSAQAVSNIHTMENILSEEAAPRRVGMLLLVVFAATALALAALGIYGVLAYFVVQHTHEIGVRLALGAQPRSVLALVLRRGMGMVLAGVVLGLCGAFILTRLMASLLYGVSATDPLVFGGVAAVLTTVALVACYVPARRATKVDPLIALRS